MSIASEISRLQTAKSCLKGAIESKGITVGSNLTIDQYYNCVNAIQQGIVGLCFADILIVGAGGAGGWSNSNVRAGGGGGGGEVICREYFKLSCNSYQITVGCANGGTSCVGTVLCARGGCQGCYGQTGSSQAGGASGSGQVGGNSSGNSYSAGGGGGAFSAGCTPSGQYDGGNGGRGLYGYGGGGGGGGSGTCGCGYDGGASVGGSPTNCGGGGAGAAGYRSDSTSGAPGVVIICYKPDGSYGFTNATGGTKTSCDGYCIHTFTSNGTFSITG